MACGAHAENIAATHIHLVHMVAVTLSFTNRTIANSFRRVQWADSATIPRACVF
jgi:hypothetical protein